MKLRLICVFVISEVGIGYILDAAFRLLDTVTATFYMNLLGNAVSLDDLAKMVCDHLGCGAALVTRVTETRQLILASYCQNTSAQFQSSVPLTHSICQHTAAMNFPLAIDDMSYHPLLKGNLAFSELGVAAYLGAPVHIEDGKPIGAICALEFRQRRWSTEDVDLISAAAKVADRLLVETV